MAVEHDRRERRCDENGMDAKLVRIRKMGHFWDLAFVVISQPTPLMGEGGACGGGGVRPVRRICTRMACIAL